MARGQVQRPETPDEMYQRLFEAGAVIQMYHPGKGIRYITNTEFAIAMARRRGYTDVEYVEETVKKPVVKAKEAEVEKPKAAAKTESKFKGGA